MTNFVNGQPILGKQAIFDGSIRFKHLCSFYLFGVDGGMYGHRLSDGCMKDRVSIPTGRSLHCRGPAVHEMMAGERPEGVLLIGGRGAPRG